MNTNSFDDLMISRLINIKFPVHIPKLVPIEMLYELKKKSKNKTRFLLKSAFLLKQ